MTGDLSHRLRRLKSTTEKAVGFGRDHFEDTPYDVHARSCARCAELSRIASSAERAPTDQSEGQLNRVGSPLTGPYSHHFLHRQDENLSVADPSGSGAALNRIDHLADQFVRDDNFEFDLG